jgi:hypothetical protein
MIDDGHPIAPEGPRPEGFERRLSDEELALAAERAERDEMLDEDIEAWVPEQEIEFWSSDGGSRDHLHQLCYERMRDHGLLKELDDEAVRVVELLQLRFSAEPFRSPPGHSSCGVPVPELAAELGLEPVIVVATVHQLKPWRVERVVDAGCLAWLTVGNHYWLPAADQSARERGLREREVSLRQQARSARRVRLSGLAAAEVKSAVSGAAAGAVERRQPSRRLLVRWRRVKAPDCAPEA